MQRLLLLLAVVASIAAVAQLRDFDLTAPDGTKLKATFYAASDSGGKPAPAVMLLHMCNTNRKSWVPVAEQLSATGVNALTIDNRGFGESGGPRFDGATAQQFEELSSKWPDDFDTAFAWLLAQPGVDKSRIGAGGGSCGVNNAVQLARRHPEVRSLVLLAGSTDGDGVAYLRKHAWIPLFTAAAADDEYDARAPQLMRWMAEITGNPRNQFVGFQNGHHGTEIFGPHPELPKEIVAFYVETLVKSPANANAKFTPKKSAILDFWTAASEAGGPDRAAQMFHDARKRDPNAFLFPEVMLNELAYTRLRDAGIGAGGLTAPAVPPPPKDAALAEADALTLFKLNVEAYPTSANAQDSLGDGYMANGQNAEALAAEQKCLELLPNEKMGDPFKAQVREAAEKKIAKLKQ